MAVDADLLLGRVMIAAAWADGELSTEEREALADLLFTLPNLTGETWRSLRADIDRPFDASRVSGLVKDLGEALGSEADRLHAISVLDAFIARLGSGSPESAALEEARNALVSGEPAAGSGAGASGNSGGWLQKLTRGLGGGLKKHAGVLMADRAREANLETRLAERVASHWPDSEVRPSGEEIHRLCLGAAILAHIVRLDDVVDSGEVDALREALVSHWGVGAAAASLVTEFALDESADGLDLHSLMRSFQSVTSEDERQRFLAAVFLVAAGDGRASYDEIEEVRRIGRGLLLSHKHFIAAKLSLPGGSRDT